MRRDRDLIKPNYQGDGKMYGSEIAMPRAKVSETVVDEKLELARAIARFEDDMSRDRQAPTIGVKSISIKPDGGELGGRRGLEKISPKAENNLARDIIMAVLFVLTLPTFIIPVGIIIYWSKLRPASKTVSENDPSYSRQVSNKARPITFSDTYFL